MKRPIYLDYNSTTPTDPKVLEAMKPFFSESFGNAASQAHMYGWEAEETVEQARQTVADLIGAKSKKNIIFTSGATESNNMVIKGIVHGARKKPVHIITQKTEHKSILDSCREIEKQGHEVTYIDVDSDGLVDPNDVKKAIKENTILCSVMKANNEIGTIQPIEEIASICHKKNVLFHSDAVQAVGKIPVDVQEEGIDLLSLSGHKIYGPKGIGAFYIARRSPPIIISPLLHGGGHETGKRSGTLNVPGIVGLAKALELCFDEIPREAQRLAKLRDSFIREIQSKIEGSHLNGHPTKRLPNNINISFDGIKADELILAVPEIAISSGSACSSGSPEPSYVISALTNSKERVNAAIRLGLGRWTTKENLDVALNCLTRAVEKIRAKSPLAKIK